jgi:hypothetical protein
VSMPSSKSIRLLVSLLFGLSVSISVPVSIVFKGTAICGQFKLLCLCLSFNLCVLACAKIL